MTQSSLPLVERHPLRPFLPSNAKLLMLGSFPPQRKRWSMDFYYPNFQNDMWRIMGLLFFDDKNYFVDATTKSFKKENIIAFLKETGIALYDTASAVRRLKDNASDKFLEVVEKTDVRHLLQCLPECKTIVVTGQKASEIIATVFQIKSPKVGECVTFNVEERKMFLYRMPSSSRAYPMALEKKTLFYRAAFENLMQLNRK